jgi:hypothetical protein
MVGGRPAARWPPGGLGRWLLEALEPLEPLEPLEAVEPLEPLECSAHTHTEPAPVAAEPTIYDERCPCTAGRPQAPLETLSPNTGFWGGEGRRGGEGMGGTPGQAWIAARPQAPLEILYRPLYRTHVPDPCTGTLYGPLYRNPVQGPGPAARPLAPSRWR